MLDLFPRDVFLLICNYLSITELVRTSSVCKTIRTTISDSKFGTRIGYWRNLIPSTGITKYDVAVMHKQQDLMSLFETRQIRLWFDPKYIYLATDDVLGLSSMILPYRKGLIDCCKVDAISCLKYLLQKYGKAHRGSISEDEWQRMIINSSIWDSPRCLEFLLPLHSYRPTCEQLDYLKTMYQSGNPMLGIDRRLFELKRIYDKTKGIL